MKLKLIEIAGEFCTRRTSPSLPPLKQKLREAIINDENVQISTEGVKILTPTFIDELIPDLVIEFGKDRVDRLIVFEPPLTGLLLEQIERGVKNRLR